MKVTIDIPDELAARWEAAEQMEHQAMASGLDVANRKQLAKAYRQQAAIFSELRPLVALTFLWDAAERARRSALADARDWAERADRLRAHEAKASQ